MATPSSVIPFISQNRYLTGKQLNGYGLLMWLIAGTVQPAAAVEIVQLQTTHSDNRYAMTIVMRVQAPLANVFAVLTDYANWPQLNPAIRSSEILAVHGDQTRVRSLTHPCALLFCIDIEQVQEIMVYRQNRITAQTVPAASNLRKGFVEWRLTPDKKATVLRVDAVLEPDFWVPPLFGAWLIQHTLRREAVASAHCLEKLAAPLHSRKNRPSPDRICGPT